MTIIHWRTLDLRVLAVVCRSKEEKDSNPGQLDGCLRCWNRRRSIPVGDNTVALFWDDRGIKELVTSVKGRRNSMSGSLNNWLFPPGFPPRKSS
ncbi:Microtubule-Associated Proteins 1A/1B Light Chain 3A [Manis pentadactyla]|nr:Microtubule-Associated Proteins 1A/1B Light Chain 3A [Manis pentadactyla]